MSEVKYVATRGSYGNALVELGKEHENLIVLDADLAAATMTGTFKKVFPERHIDCGIAEARISAFETAILLWETVLCDGNCLDHHADLAFVHMQLAEEHAHLRNRDRTLFHLVRALRHAAEYDALPPGEHKYTSPFVDSATCEISADRESEREYWLCEIEESGCFDFIRDDPEFVEIMNM